MGAGLVVGLAGAVVQQRTTRDALRDEAASRHASLVAELAARLDEQLRGQVELLSAVATRSQLVELSAEADGELRAVIASSTTYDELVLYDEAGAPVAAASARGLIDAGAQPERGEPMSRSTIAVRPLEPPTLEVAVPVENPPGHPVGTLVGRAPLEVIAVFALQLGDDGVTRAVVDGEGRLLVHPERDRVLRSEHVPLDDVLVTEENLAWMTRAGTTVLISAAPSRLFSGAVVLEQSEAAALAPVDERLRELSAILGLAVVGIVLAVSVAGTWLLAPLRPLTAAVARLGRGERDVRVDQLGVGEVSELATEFNRLSEALEHRRDEVEELQRLSLLVNSRTSVELIADEVVTGAVRLLPADRAAFCSAGDADAPPAVLARSGPVSEAAALERAALAIRIGRSHVDEDDGEHYAAVPITSIDGNHVGALVVVSSQPFDAAEAALAASYAAFAGVAVDNARRLSLEQDLTAELQHAVDQRRSLLSTLSHEFRTPLTCIDGFTQTLMDNWQAFDDERRQELLSKIHHHSTELGDLVERLLDFAVTERGRLTAHVEPLRLDLEVRTALSTMEPIFAGRELQVQVDPIEVLADAGMLRRAVGNLVSNAVKYSPPGSPITVRSGGGPPQVRLEVIDEGQGLTADEAARAFQPFWRAGATSTRSQRGTGLGLALVAEYARAMGGSAGVMSEPGEGSTFFITLVAR